MTVGREITKFKSYFCNIIHGLIDNKITELFLCLKCILLIIHTLCLFEYLQSIDINYEQEGLF